MLNIKKRLLSVLSAAALAVTPACLMNASAAEGADVTVKLGSAEDLVQFKTAWDNGDYAADSLTVELTDNIDMTGIEWTGMYKFKGIFDGNGYTISKYVPSQAPTFKIRTTVKPQTWDFSIP